MLKISNIEKSFGTRSVLQNLSLDIPPGEVFTLLGSSGCGKTTLLRILAGLERPDAGTVTFKGTLWADGRLGFLMPPQSRDVGLVFQNYAIWPHLKVFDQIAYPLRNRNFPRHIVRQKVETMLEKMGLTGLGDRLATQLSGGQQQRVAMGRALISEPDLLLLDEPFSNLDVSLRAQLRLEMRAIQKRLGLTIILVTHDQADAFALSDRIAIMNNGHVEQVGTADDIYSSPATPFVTSFIGRSAALRGVLRRDHKGHTFASLDRQTNVPVTLNERASHLADGNDLSLWIRPEHLRVKRADKSDAQNDGALTGLIRDRIFAGDRNECVIDLDCGQSLLSYEPIGATLPLGTAVKVAFDHHPTAFPG